MSCYFEDKFFLMPNYVFPFDSNILFENVSLDYFYDLFVEFMMFYLDYLLVSILLIILFYGV